MSKENENSNHITTRVDLEVKKAGVELAQRIERKPAWIFAKAIELGLPIVAKQYGSVPKKRAA